MTLPQLLHGFFNFLGTVEGELLKTAVELIFFTIVLYMVISEWIRSKEKEHKFLVIAFSVLVLDKLFTVYFLANFVFSNADPYFWTLNTVHNFFEIFALFLLANAFVYPIITKKGIDTKQFIVKRALMIFAVGFVLSVFMLSVIDLVGGSVDDFWTDASVDIGELLVLWYYSWYLLANQKYKLKYSSNIVFAFLIYAINPIIELFNILFYGSLNPYLNVASQPFPFVSIMVFTQVVYLKLVDKATLKGQLRKSEKLYEHEKEVSKLKDEFVSTVSHELKTPLTSMKLYVGLLRDGKLGTVGKKQKDALRIVGDETDRLNGLITDLLDLSRLESNKAKLAISEFDINEILVSKLYHDMAKKEGLSIDVNVPKDMVVVADKDKLKQVFINLFTNAVKFTSKGGRIIISAEVHDVDWSFSIEDTGRGIAKDKIPKLFEKFYQIEDYMTRTKGGFGLGLSIVKGIVELHKGRIAVESEVGRGTTFKVAIPKITQY